MAMTVKKGDVVKLNNREWSYSGKHTVGHIGVVTAIHDMPDPITGHQWVNLDDESGSPYWMPVTDMSMVADSGTLFEDMFEDMEEGDILVATARNDDTDNNLVAGDHRVAYADGCGCYFHFLDEDGDTVSHWDDNFYFINLSALRREHGSDASVAVGEVLAFPIYDVTEASPPAPVHPKYDDMDDAAKGLILLAVHEGKTVQFLSNISNVWMDDTSFDSSENFAYRVKPQELIDAEEALNAAASNVASLDDARDAANAAAERANAAWASAGLEWASAKDTVVALNAA